MSERPESGFKAMPSEGRPAVVLSWFFCGAFAMQEWCDRATMRGPDARTAGTWGSRPPTY
ncbi:hypothetical protein [Glycomyces sp. NRRL B-16210]|uniref:hypothetical protein n=1 Tax=Glycomyces sp. NRRL B-16210 TaxID=1463821 RepID=UPI0004C07E9B|nr:hypothetical protein [Glycomyces sp. NRRL B-16210]